ncbi:MAG: Fic family protein [Turicibacter sp.]|nr:Fic family protein [Turicibacter sp.]
MDEMTLLERLLEEKKVKARMIYYGTQISMAYNSNKIEGSRLSETQTKFLFETGTLVAEQNQPDTKVDDIFEAINHFECFDFVLDTIDEPLSHDYLFKMHRLLKKGTSDDRSVIMNVGQYKKYSNIVGGFVKDLETTPPEEVDRSMDILIKEYEALFPKDLEKVVDFHVDFETIHPFSDGNGRLGRLVMFKECLRNGILPFVVNDEYRSFYIQGLDEYREGNKEMLLDTFGASQDNYSAFLRKLGFSGAVR